MALKKNNNTHGRVPRFLPEVINAIFELKDNGGSKPSDIITYLKGSIDVNSRNFTTQIRRALKSGLDYGVIMHRAGRYRLSNRQVNPFDGIVTARRRGRKSRRRPRRRRRRSLSSETQERKRSHASSDTQLSGNSNPSSAGTSPPAKRRTNNFKIRSFEDGKWKRRPAPRRGRRKQSQEQALDEQNANHNQSAKDENNTNGQQNGNDCGNPGCLCNIKQEDGGNNNNQ